MQEGRRIAAKPAGLDGAAGAGWRTAHDVGVRRLAGGHAINAVGIAHRAQAAWVARAVSPGGAEVVWLNGFFADEGVNRWATDQRMPAY